MDGIGGDQRVRFRARMLNRAAKLLFCPRVVAEPARDDAEPHEPLGEDRAVAESLGLLERLLQRPNRVDHGGSAKQAVPDQALTSEQCRAFVAELRRDLEELGGSREIASLR